MSLVNLIDVRVSFGAVDVVRGVTAEINQGDRIGLIGRNGAGKTTLLEVMAGLQSPTTGRCQVSKTTRIALVQQVQADSGTGATVEEEAMSALEDIVTLERELEEAAHALKDGDEEATARYAILHERLELHGFNYLARVSEVLTGLGLPKSLWGQPVAVLSGGQRGRLAIAKAILSTPDLLLMDEPTNHLDMDALQWLDGFLARWPGTLVVTSHDRYFLDRVATRIWLMRSGQVTSYRGNYSKSDAQRQADETLQQKQFEAQQEYIAKEEDFIRRYGAGQRAREAQGRQKRLDRMERLESVTTERATKLAFKSQRSGDVVMATKGFSAGYGSTAIVTLPETEVLRGDRIALIGPNGAGKTTLLRTIAGELHPVEGTPRRGSNVTVAHYWQEAEDLDNSRMVLDEMLSLPRMEMQAARNILGAFLFSGDDVFKTVSALSGGERSRLALAKLVQAEANFLLLDEPTNHLDIPSRESLERALAAYAGTLLFASHDRRLISEVATRLWVIKEGRLSVFNGTYQEYLDSQASPKAVASYRAAAPVATSKPASDRKRQEALRLLEDDITRREAELAALGEKINASSAAGDLKAVETLGQRFHDLQAELHALQDKWLAEA